MKITATSEAHHRHIHIESAHFLFVEQKTILLLPRITVDITVKWAALFARWARFFYFIFYFHHSSCIVRPDTDPLS